MEHAESLAVVWALGLLVAAAGSILESVLITSVGLLAVVLMLAAVTVLTADLRDGTRGWAGSPDRIEE